MRRKGGSESNIPRAEEGLAEDINCFTILAAIDDISIGESKKASQV